MLRKAFVLSIATIIAAVAACSSFEDSPPGPAPIDAGGDDGRAISSDDAASADATPFTDADADADAGDASPSAIYRQAVLAAGPVAYWRMGRIESSTLVPDETVNAAPLALSGAEAGVAGIFADDTAVGFGPNAFAEATSSAVLEFVGVLPYSLECWARHDGAIDGGSYFEQVLSFIGGTPGGSQDGYFMYLQNDVPPKMIGLRDAPDANAQQTSSTFPDDHAWHHHVMTFDGQSVRMYLDGQPKGSVTMNAPIGARPSQKFTVARASNEASRYFNGALDEIAVYPIALDVVTIANHHDLGTKK